MKIDKRTAAEVLRDEAARTATSGADRRWISKIEEFSRLCEASVSKTHVAFLGTAILAKAMNLSADLYAIKPSHAPGNVNAFSARTLCHSVLVPLSAELGFSIGVTGREPLNNQPYFRMTRLGDGTPVHPGGRQAFEFMLELVAEVSEIKSNSEARSALRAFVAVRRQYVATYGSHSQDAQITPGNLIRAVSSFVSNRSEGGKRAQAAVAGLLDISAGREFVHAGRVNDPSRKYPGDVTIHSSEHPEQLVRAIEVRDKPVSISDIHIYATRCIAMKVSDAAVVMVSADQPELDSSNLYEWASSRGVGLTLFHGWAEFVDQALFWGKSPKLQAATEALETIHERLIEVEVSSEGVELWQETTRNRKSSNQSKE